MVGTDQLILDAKNSVRYEKKSVKLKFPYRFTANIKIILNI